MSGAVETSGGEDDRVWTVTLRNEGKRNALDFELVAELRATFEALAERAAPPVVVLRGAGAAFCAGFDLTVDRREREADLTRRWPAMTDAVASYPYPVVAAVNGDAYGGGVELAAACDLRVAAEGARFAVTPAKIGLVYGGRATERVVRLVGPATTKRLLFTGEALPASEAADAGLVGEVVPDGEAVDRATDLARTVAGNAPLSLRASKQVVDAVAAGRLTDAEVAWVRRLRKEALASDDHAEGLAAFREGREPEFEGW